MNLVAHSQQDGSQLNFFSAASRLPSKFIKKRFSAEASRLFSHAAALPRVDETLHI